MSAKNQTAKPTKPETGSKSVASSVVKSKTETPTKPEVSKAPVKTDAKDKSAEPKKAAAAPKPAEAEYPLNTSDRAPKLAGLIILLGTFGLFGGWAALAPLDAAALAPGVVTVETYRKTVQHLEGGIIADIMVRDGDQVEAGAPLLVLDDTQTRAELGIVSGQLIATEAVEARLRAQRDSLEQVEYPVHFDFDDDRIKEAVASENAVFVAQTTAQKGEVSVLQQRITQLEEKASGLRDLITSRRQLAASYADEAKELEELLSDGFVDKQRIRELDRKIAEVNSEIAEQTSAIAQIEIQKGEAELNVIQLQNKFQTEVVGRLSEAQAKLFDLRERYSAIQDRLTRTVMRAPESGMVIGMSVHTIGGVVQPAAPILEIVPKGSALIVEGQVSPLDIDRVHNGLIAEVRFSSFKSSLTPVLQGEVVHISADRLVNEQTGMPYYLAKVKLTDRSVKDLGGLQLLPGMPAEVLIKTGERTLFEYLVQPATNAFARSFIED